MNPLLLDIDNSSPLNPSYIGLVALLIVLSILATRAIFSIPRLIRSQRAQAYLLGLIAERQGCDQKQIDKAFQHIDGDLIVGELHNRQMDRELKKQHHKPTVDHPIT